MVKDDKEFINRKIEEALNSGAINRDDYENDFELPKIIYYAILQSLSDQRLPLHPKGKKEAENLSCFI